MKEILQNAPRFSSRAEYYSGRGAILADLNEEILEHIWDQIHKHYGRKASSSFVKMVASMENCNATDFINNCYALESYNWEWKIEVSKKFGIEVAKDKDGNYDLNHGMLSIMESMSNHRDQTDAIRNGFLHNHHYPIKGKVFSDNGRIYEIYYGEKK